MLKFDIETSSSAISITKPINQPVRRFKISRCGWFNGKRIYTEVGEDVTFTIGWLNRFKSWFWGGSTIQVKGNVPEVTLNAQYSSLKMVLRDFARGIDMAWHSPNQYVIRQADHEIARIYIYKASFGFTDDDNYVLIVLDEDADLMLLFVYVFCFKFVMAGEAWSFGDSAVDGSGSDSDCDSDSDGGDGDCDGGDCDGGGDGD